MPWTRRSNRTPYVDSEKETDRRLEQFYTEGLAAFYTEDWDRACQRFQSILSERPNHKNAAEKLEEAERQRNLSKLYEQASAAVRSEDWGTAIQILEELSHKSADYKDAAQLLRNARQQSQLRELYAEAKALHTGQQWEAVVRVFQQISSIDSNYLDSDGLLPSAQKEVAELKRLADLNDQYSHALREMDAGNWYEARSLLESVHKSETGYLETEKLLKKVENRNREGGAKAQTERPGQHAVRTGAWTAPLEEVAQRPRQNGGDPQTG
jgi:outer membrane protein assembly factor BamD (BamD/ComL family)